MIVGIGTDRIVVARVEASLERFGQRFIQRVYTEREHEQARNKNMFGRRLAMLFAAKEAVSKALGTGFHQGVSPKHIETIHRSSGKPEVFLYAGAAHVAQRLGVSAVHVSLSDDDGIAMAFAIAEKSDD